MSVEAPVAPAATPAAPATPPVQPTHSSGVQDHFAKEWIGSDFTLNPKALERLPDHLKPLKSLLERHKSFDDVLTTMQNQQLMVGKKALAPLPADAPANVLAERKALLDTINGVPSSPKEYGIAKPQDLPDNQWDQNLADGFAAWAHKHSVPPGAAKELIAIQAEAIKTQMASQGQYEQQFWADEQKNFEAVLRQENIPADRASALVEKGAVALGMDLTNEKTKRLLQSADARLMAMRHAMAIGEDRAVTGGEGGSGGPGNPAELAQDILTNPANPLNGPYWNKDGKYSRSAQESAIAKRNEYLRLAAAKNPPRGKR